MNLLDRAIAAIAPSMAVRRAQARSALAFYSAWEGASMTRAAMQNWIPNEDDADTTLSYELPFLRARAKDAYRNAPLAGAAINTMVSHVVGTGLSLQLTPDQEYLGWSDKRTERWKANVYRRWVGWAERTDCDITRAQNFYALQDLALRAMLVHGDVFPVLTEHTIDAADVLAVQLIAAARVTNPDGSPDTDTLKSGVEINAAGAPVAYHVMRRHPGATALTADAYRWDRITAFGADSGRRNVLHLFERLEPSQSRGVPILAPVLEQLKQLHRYTEAELQAAVTSAAFAVFIRMDPNAFAELFGDSAQTYMNRAQKWDGTIPTGTLSGPGQAVNLLPGEDPVAVEPTRPNAQFDPFVMAIVRQIGARLGIPFEVMIKHFSSSYSASRAALLDAWRVFRVRREFMASAFCQPIFEEWLTREIMAGNVAAPGFFGDRTLREAYTATNWIGDGPGSINPRDDAAAARERIDIGISTIAAESILHDGVDWEVKHRQRVKEADSRKGSGLEIDMAAAVGGQG